MLNKPVFLSVELFENIIHRQFSCRYCTV